MISFKEFEGTALNTTTQPPFRWNPPAALPPRPGETETNQKKTEITKAVHKAFEHK
jgi:hypothetical protein